MFYLHSLLTGKGKEMAKATKSVREVVNELLDKDENLKGAELFAAVKKELPKAKEGNVKQARSGWRKDNGKVKERAGTGGQSEDIVILLSGNLDKQIERLQRLKNETTEDERQTLKRYHDAVAARDKAKKIVDDLKVEYERIIAKINGKK